MYLSQSGTASVLCVWHEQITNCLSWSIYIMDYGKINQPFNIPYAIPVVLIQNIKLSQLYLDFLWGCGWLVDFFTHEPNFKGSMFSVTNKQDLVRSTFV